MNATARQARATLRARHATTRAQARIHRNGAATLATYATAAGLTTGQAASVAGSLRTAARRLGITGAEGTAFRKGARRACRRYTPAEVHLIAMKYAPRKDAYKTARTYLLAA